MNKKAIIGRIVDRFLGWRLPREFNPDAGISFAPIYPYEGDERGNSWWPVGTNLFTADQTEAMLEEIAGEEIEFSLQRIADVSESEHTCNKLLVREGMAHKKTLERLRAMEHPKPNLPGWEIDMSTGTPILVFEKCSVIQDDQAYLVLASLRAHDKKGE